MKKNIILSGIAGAALMLALATTAFAYQTDGRAYGFIHDPQRIAAIDTAFAHNDLTTLNQLMTVGCHAGIAITSENVGKFGEMWKYMREGNYIEMRKVRDSLGYPTNTRGYGMMGGRGAGYGMMRGW